MNVDFAVVAPDPAGTSAQAAALAELISDDVLGQLIERRGRMAELATEGQDVKLDWVDQLTDALAHPERLTATVELAERLTGGCRHLVWSGMGGSIQAVRTLGRLGALDGAPCRVHPLDSTDPRALGRLVRDLGGEDGLAATALVAVSMGMTSEEPIAHLEWLGPLLEAANPAEARRHQVVMTLAGSLLDRHAEAARVLRVPIQLNGEDHMPGRMSAPATRVFLLPAAIRLKRAESLVELVRRIVDPLPLGPGLTALARQRLLETDPFVALGAWLGAHLRAGRDQVLLETDAVGSAVAPWVEQLVEESLCKEGRGLLVFLDQRLSPAADPARLVRLRLRAADGTAVPAGGPSDLPTAELAMTTDGDPLDRLALAGRVFAGFSLAVALIGYLNRLVFAGQPAVEGYKRYARELRDAPGPLPFPEDHLSTQAGCRLWWAPLVSAGALSPADFPSGDFPSGDFSSGDFSSADGRDARPDGPAAVLAAALARLQRDGRLVYLDLTVNGDPEGPAWDELAEVARHLANEVLRCPIKLRSGPRDYHSTEQSEVDGPPGVMSLRVVARELPAVPAGCYDPRFFHAQALGTVFAVRDAGRPVALALLQNDRDVDTLVQILRETAARLDSTRTSPAADTPTREPTPTREQSTGVTAP